MMSNNLFVNVNLPIAIKSVNIPHPDYSVVYFFQQQPSAILAVQTLGSRANPWLTFYYIITKLRKTATQLNV